MMAEMDHVLGDAVVVEMAMVGVVDMMAEMDMVTIATITTPTKPNPMHLDFILWQNGTSFPLKS